MKCLLCNEEYERITASHLRSAHDIDTDDYATMFPDASMCAQSDETRKRISTTKMGHEVGEETRQKISETVSVTMNTPKMIQRMSETHLGKAPSKETCQRLSESMRTVWSSGGYRQRMYEARVGRVFSEETCHKISEALIGRSLSEETKQRISEAQEGRILSPEHCLAISKSNKEDYQSDSTRTTRVSRTLKERWKDEDFARYMSKAQHRKPNGPELQLQSVLDKHFPNEWKYAGDGSFWIEGRNPDFANIDGKKQVIEVFGYYWHLCQPDRPTEEELAAHYKSYGFDCLIFWEYDVWDEDEVVTKIKEL